ncbi:hypothetical protein LTR86_001012 [Recurvomyces mirabilis]|nr:hypothetical protein LTR86_001012 [Recurvomyces mirabilis]
MIGATTRAQAQEHLARINRPLNTNRSSLLLTPKPVHTATTSHLAEASLAIQIPHSKPVVEGQRSLIRTCPHGKSSFKGKVRLTETNYHLRCECKKTQFEGSAPKFGGEHYMLKTIDRLCPDLEIQLQILGKHEEDEDAGGVALESGDGMVQTNQMRDAALSYDLRTWIHRFSETDKKQDLRDWTYLETDLRFTSRHLRQGILYAISLLHDLHAQIPHLLSYAERYNIFIPDLLDQPEPSWLAPIADQERELKGMGRQALLDTFGAACQEIDYFVAQKEDLLMDIRKGKIVEARDGDESERCSLVAAGYEEEIRRIVAKESG